MTNTLLPPWRETVRAAARHAARVDDRKRWNGDNPPFRYRWEHVQAVVRLAVRLAKCTGADLEVCEAAAWLHDVAKPQPAKPTVAGSTRVGDGRPGDDPRRDHGHDGAIIARRILKESDFPAEKVEAVTDAIAKHVGLSREEPVEPLEAAVLWDADKLSKLGATIVLHGVGYLLAEGTNETGQLIERLWDDGWAEGIADNLNTAPARVAGRARLETYRAFCRQAVAELHGDDLPYDASITTP